MEQLGCFPTGLAETIILRKKIKQFKNIHFKSKSSSPQLNVYAFPITWPTHHMWGVCGYSPVIVEL